MKICMIHHYGRIGGGTISCLNVAQVLQEIGHSVILYITNPDNNVRDLCLKKGIRFLVVPNIIELNYHSANRNFVKSILKYIISLRLLRIWQNIFHNLKEQSIDIVIFNSLKQSPLIDLCNKEQIKCLCFIRETILGTKKSFINRIIRNKLSKLDGICFLSEFDKSSWGDLGSAKSFVVPDTIAPEICKIPIESKTILRKQAGIFANGPFFLYFGGISYAKGALDLLEAFKRFVNEGYKGYLIILGDLKGDILESYSFFRFRQRQFVKACFERINEINKLEKRVFAIGITSWPGLWYYLSDVVVCPIKQVHQARLIFESGYFRKAVIIPNYINYKEFIEDGKNGFVFIPNDIESLKTAMVKAVSDLRRLELIGIDNYKRTLRGHLQSISKDIIGKQIQILVNDK